MPRSRKTTNRWCPSQHGSIRPRPQRTGLPGPKRVDEFTGRHGTKPFELYLAQDSLRMQETERWLRHRYPVILRATLARGTRASVRPTAIGVDRRDCSQLTATSIAAILAHNPNFPNRFSAVPSSATPAYGCYLLVWLRGSRSRSRFVHGARERQSPEFLEDGAQRGSKPASIAAKRLQACISTRLGAEFEFDRESRYCAKDESSRVACDDGRRPAVRERNARSTLAGDGTRRHRLLTGMVRALGVTLELCRVEVHVPELAFAVFLGLIGEVL